MNIFTTFQSKVQSPKQPRPELKPQNKRAEKLDLSPQQIRDKVNLHFNKSTSEQTQTNREEEPVIQSDIATNDPKSPQTQKKLKAVLADGTFSFSAKEKEVLSSILGN
jgi:multidrug efflux pump subunit AcrB